MQTWMSMQVDNLDGAENNSSHNSSRTHGVWGVEKAGCWIEK